MKEIANDNFTEKRGNPRWKKGTSGNYNGAPKKYKYSGKDAQKNYRLIGQYGITLDEYNAMLEKQDGVCAICGNPEVKAQARNGTNGIKNLDSLLVDHDHKTGKVRGLLCYRCNTGIGKLNDDPNLLRKAARYIGYVIEE